MCTALTYKTADSYFGRNLDLEYSYNETVTVTPRNFPFQFRRLKTSAHHHAMIGMAYVVEDYPLYYDAVNEHGLAMAGLNFPDNAVYYEEEAGKENVTPFEFIPYILGKCATVCEARDKLASLNLINLSFSDRLPLSPLHWMIADKEQSIVVETRADGMRIYDNPVGILTNNPPFDYMLHFLCDYQHISAGASVNRLAPALDLTPYCRGLAAKGLPGDWSSTSRFVRGAFLRQNAASDASEEASVGQFFHMLGAVEMPRGAVHVQGDIYDITVYSSCCNQHRGIYYYTTYENRQINAVDMHREDLEGHHLISYPLQTGQVVYEHN